MILFLWSSGSEGSDYKFMGCKPAQIPSPWIQTRTPYSCITISVNFVQLYHSTWKSKALQSTSSSLACYGADLFFCDFANKWDIMCHTPQKIVDTCTTNALASLLGNIPAHQQRFWIRLAMPYNQAPPCTRPMTLNASKSGCMATRWSNVNMWEDVWLIVEVTGCVLCMKK